MAQQRPSQNQRPLRFLRGDEVETRTGFSASQRDVLEHRGEFPRRVQLSTRCVGWVEHEVDAWCAARIAARDAMTEEAA